MCGCKSNDNNARHRRRARVPAHRIECHPYYLISSNETEIDIHVCYWRSLWKRHRLTGTKRKHMREPHHVHDSNFPMVLLTHSFYHGIMNTRHVTKNVLVANVRAYTAPGLLYLVTPKATCLKPSHVGRISASPRVQILMCRLVTRVCFLLRDACNRKGSATLGDDTPPYILEAGVRTGGHTLIVFIAALCTCARRISLPRIHKVVNILREFDPLSQMQWNARCPRTETHGFQIREDIVSIMIMLQTISYPH